MKVKLLIVIVVIGVAFIFANKQREGKKLNAADAFSSQQSSSNMPAPVNPGTFFSSAVNSTSSVSAKRFSSVAHAVSSASVSSLNSLSGARVDPLPEIANFLHQLDSVVIPKIYLPTPKRDFGFDYGKAKPSALRDKAMVGDPYAAYHYAEYIVKNGVRTVTDTGVYAYELDTKKRNFAMVEAREFYIRAFRGGIASTADVLSRLYATSVRGGNRIESLAWRKISFAVGESERFECLRNSTTCIVKDFNSLNRLEFFYPCLSSSGDSCTQSEYDTAMMLALQYADSLEFAMNNKVWQ